MARRLDRRWRLLRDPESDRVGLGWYLQHHSVWALPWRVIKGAGQSIGVLIYTAGPGVTAGTPAHLEADHAAAILRVIGGVVVVAFAARGLIDRYREGHRTGVLAVTHVGGWMLLAFAVGAQGVGGVATRFMSPFVVLCIPYAAHALVQRADRGRAAAWLARPWAASRCCLPFAIKLTWFAPAFAANPTPGVHGAAAVGRGVGVAPRAPSARRALRRGAERLFRPGTTAS